MAFTNKNKEKTDFLCKKVKNGITISKNTAEGSEISEPSAVLGYPDSNQERQDQNLQCYHYTIAQCSNAMQRYIFFL